MRVSNQFRTVETMYLLSAITAPVDAVFYNKFSIIRHLNIIAPPRPRRSLPNNGDLEVVFNLKLKGIKQYISWCNVNYVERMYKKLIGHIFTTRSL